MQKQHQKLILIFLGIVMLSASLVFYFNYRMDILKQDYDLKITDLSRTTIEGLKNVRSSIESNVDLLNSSIIQIDASLDHFKKQNEEEVNTLTRLIEQIEQQSNIQLTELKGELKNIQIKSADFSAIVNDVLDATVSIQTDKARGSGVIISSKGYVITNVHVINGATSVKIITNNGDSYSNVQLVGYDGPADIAVLKINAPNLKYLEFGNSDDMKVGERVIAAGNPAGLDFTVTEGIVSAFREFNNYDYLQIDVPINPGNSGGPLVNIKSEIVGINNFKASSFEGLGFAITSNNVNDISAGLISTYEQNNP
ncbi:MAG: trypsin-like peptidase domain-containing protein [Nanoarchaeota archaeon]